MMVEKLAINSSSIKTTPLINLLCDFNGGCVPEMLNCEIRNNYSENLQFIKSLTSMSLEDVKKAGVGQKEFNESSVTPGKRFLITNHLKNRFIEVYPKNFTEMGSDRMFALRGYLSITIRYVIYSIILYFKSILLCSTPCQSCLSSSSSCVCFGWWEA